MYNNITSDSNVAPSDVFRGEIFPCYKLRTFHVWGCPLYVLDPKISNAQNISHWKPKSMRGIFLGYSPTYSSNVPLVLNLNTGNISSQFYMVFIDTFIIVQYIFDDKYPPSILEQNCTWLFHSSIPVVALKYSCTSWWMAHSLWTRVKTQVLPIWGPHSCLLSTLPVFLFSGSHQNCVSFRP